MSPAFLGAMASSGQRYLYGDDGHRSAGERQGIILNEVYDDGIRIPKDRHGLKQKKIDYGISVR